MAPDGFRTGMPKKILIAEDEPSIALSLEFLLRGAGYEVALARNGSEAVRIGEREKPDLIVLDIMLPLLDGFEVCRHIRESGGLGHTRILMLTARGNDSAVEKGLMLGANAYMTKPFSTRDLIRTVGELLSATER